MMKMFVRQIMSLADDVDVTCDDGCDAAPVANVSSTGKSLSEINAGVLYEGAGYDRSLL